MWAYYRELLKRAFTQSIGPIDLWTGLAGAVLAFIDHYLPHVQLMSTLGWQIALWTCVAVILARLALAPYWMAKEDKDKIIALRDEADKRQQESARNRVEFFFRQDLADHIKTHGGPSAKSEYHVGIISLKGVGGKSAEAAEVKLVSYSCRPSNRRQAVDLKLRLEDEDETSASINSGDIQNYKLFSTRTLNNNVRTFLAAFGERFEGGNLAAYGCSISPGEYKVKLRASHKDITSAINVFYYVKIDEEGSHQLRPWTDIDEAQKS